MTYKGGGKSGRFIVKLTSEPKIQSLYAKYRERQEVQLTKEEATNWKYDRTIDMLFRRFETTVEVPALREGLGIEEIELARQAKEFDTNYMTVNQTKEVVWYSVPSQEKRTELLKEYHSQFHKGTCKMRDQFKEDKIVWPKIQESIDKYVKTCTVCQLNKSPGTTHIPYRTIISERPLQHIYFDISFLSRDTSLLEL